MYIPDLQKIATASLAFAGLRTSSNIVSKGSVVDYAVEKCLDSDGHVRCTKPFLVSQGSCYKIEWSTDGALSHTTVEVRDAGSNEIVYYRDTNGEWRPDKGELVYLDFKPKIWKTGNDTVDYQVSKCDKEEEL
ncbi:uncharacterized protein UV8b_06477 [Ustilaginoidea virens]|uniref:CND01770-like protein n=1 Tax=Ustilaginoidea virens TaxID=1159556 RepID=A0A8E5MJW3_USTVR|nr:uncharacterized protein UV8b_06477 [Ustilaginoidea virens]QUC22236.1 hypothetical protein UV8b_06477 [Ustilaginoidea virens]